VSLLYPVYFTVVANQSGGVGDQDNAGAYHRNAEHSRKGDVLAEKSEAEDGRKDKADGHEWVGGTHFHLG